MERNLVRQPARGTVVRLGALPPLVAWLDARRIETPTGCVGVIRFNVWMTSIAAALDDAVNESRECDGIVLDLRGNVGGLAAMISGVAGYFVNSDMLLGVMHMRGADLRYTVNPRHVTRTGERMEPYAGPLAIVVDGLSASTTEIFASALQHYQRARVFGDTTAGEALPSLLTRLPNGDGMQYAVADLTDPGGRRLEGQGVVPADVVPLTRAALAHGRDDALQAAVGWIEHASSRRNAPSLRNERSLSSGGSARSLSSRGSELFCHPEGPFHHSFRKSNGENPVRLVYARLARNDK